MIPFFLLSDETKKWMKDRDEREVKRRLKECVDWDPKIKWQPELNINASSYSCLNLFPELKPDPDGPNPNKVKKGRFIDSPSGEWRYIINRIKAGTKLSTWQGSRIGDVLFNGPVDVPAIYRRESDEDEKLYYSPNPWMSLTPAEFLSMRTGLRSARGHTVVAGLGLGHLLIEATKKKSVKKVTLVEISQELVDWLYPRIKPHLMMDVDVRIGDANTIIPGLEADAALIDIFHDYGSNEFRAPHEHIDRVWVWGSAAVGDSHSYF